MSKKPEIRELGEILLELEPLLDEMIMDHGMQWGDVMGLIRAHLEIHLPCGREEYEDGDSPMFYYGPQIKVDIKKKGH